MQSDALKTVVDLLRAAPAVVGADVLTVRRDMEAAVAGDSAGGGLTLATLVALREAGDPPPAAGLCVSPWTDLPEGRRAVDEMAAFLEKRLA
jgi:acetyl esterase/lipase